MKEFIMGWNMVISEGLKGLGFFMALLWIVSIGFIVIGGIGYISYLIVVLYKRIKARKNKNG